MKKKESENKSYKPEWAPENAGDEFAVKIVKGIPSATIKSENLNTNKKKEHSVDELIKGILKNDRVLLAKAITLVESNSQKHFYKSQELLNKILPKTGNSVRIGISGVPGAGKSTFIETFGMHLISLGHRVAVLSIDPSSTITKGSILGDKTRMEKLSREQNCFIRPSPTSGTLGGVARKTQETILLCEAAGYDIILIETVGVGQSEIAVRSMVDFFLLMLIPGAGDELQGIKKGIIEIADGILINKADGENEKNAKIAQAELSSALHYLTAYTKGWKTNVHLASALTGMGIENIWNVINRFLEITKSNNEFYNRRKEQLIQWMYKIVENELMNKFYNSEFVKETLEQMKKQIINGSLLPTTAADKLLRNIKF